ncbi:hypothetical protein CQW23_33351 [Capsicum baccatum]|uniref:Uncharacterized protein n=1 Tax=Capsicum baccatum TaxID=33114 RepID=A0A2G2V233_CAPBA|nr:hypothetical protein CQW23_33351 [Capsicum baccatum]
MDNSLIHAQSPYIEMMKKNFFFFRSSTNDANKTPSPSLKSKEVSSCRSVSLSSRSFYDSGSGKKNFTDLNKSPHGHSKKVHLRNLVVIQAGKVKELKLETLLTTLLREKLYSEEMDIKQLQADLAATVRGNDILKCEVRNVLDALSCATPKLKYLELQAEDLSMTSKPRKCFIQCTNQQVPNLDGRKKTMFHWYGRNNFMCKTGGFSLDLESLIPFNNQMIHNSDGRQKPYNITPRKSLAFKSHNPDVCQKVQRPSLGVKKLGRSFRQSCRDKWYFGHCISYAVVASVLLGATVSRHLSVTEPLAARRDTLQSIVIRLREGFRRKDQNSSATSSEGCGSSFNGSISADASHLGNATVPCTGDGSTWNNIEGINSDKSIDSGRPSLALRSSSYRSVVQETDVESSYVDRNLEHNSSLVVCSNSGLESQGGDSSTSTSANQ